MAVITTTEISNRVISVILARETHSNNLYELRLDRHKILCQRGRYENVVHIEMFPGLGELCHLPICEKVKIRPRGTGNVILWRRIEFKLKIFYASDIVCFNKYKECSY